jgi:hypothetical protein
VTTSAYPLPVDELTDRVREHATRIGDWPSRRQVMSEFRVGRPKATAALDALRAAGFTPTPDTASTPPATPPATASDVESDAVALTGLRVVPDTTDGVEPPDPADAAPAGAGSTAAQDDHADAPSDSAEHESDPVEVRAAAVDVPADVPAGVTTPAVGESSPVSDVVDAPSGDQVPVGSGDRARVGSWPLVLIALGAFVSIWGGWVGLGELTGFGEVRLLPGIADTVKINSAITLPIGVEAYAAFALRAWLAPAGGLSERARSFARWSAIGALALGAAGQIAYHLMVAAGITTAPWVITAFVSCLPVVVLGCGAALAHLIHQSHQEDPR